MNPKELIKMLKKLKGKEVILENSRNTDSQYHILDVREGVEKLPVGDTEGTETEVIKIIF